MISGGGGSYGEASDTEFTVAVGEGHGSVSITYYGPIIDLSTCGNGVVDEGEEYDPAPGPFSSVSVDDETCRWDFSGVRQLYCNGSCSWEGASSCDAADADILCKLITDNPASTAISWTDTTAQDLPGFPCPGHSAPTEVYTERGVSHRVTYQDWSILSDHGSGEVILDPVCTDP
jgi:hypothetical protein